MRRREAPGPRNHQRLRLVCAAFALIAAPWGCSAKTPDASATAGAHDAGVAGGAPAPPDSAAVGGNAASAAGGSRSSSVAGSHAGEGGGSVAKAGAGGAANAGAGGVATAMSGGAGAGPQAGMAGGAAGSGVGCNAPGLIFCDDFETVAAGMPPPSPRWSVALNGMGTVAIDAMTAAHSGTKSVHIDSAGGYQTFFALTGAPVFPAQGALYVRLYIRLKAPMSSGHNTYYKAGAADAVSSDHETRVGVMNGMLMINQPASDRGFLSNQNYYNDNKPGVVFAPMTWTCVEALFDPSSSTFDAWVDGKEVPDLHRTDWQQDPLGSFYFGFEKYAGPDAELWYDDIAIGSARIAC